MKNYRKYHMTIHVDGWTLREEGNDEPLQGYFILTINRFTIP